LVAARSSTSKTDPCKLDCSKFTPDVYDSVLASNI
jgi:hypothetical protein